MSRIACRSPRRRTASASRWSAAGRHRSRWRAISRRSRYLCTVFDQDPKAGGMMRSQIRSFRLPDAVIDEETGYILNLGIEFNGGTRIDSLKKLLAENYDAIFVGSGAPRGRELDIPGRKEAAQEHPHRHRLAVVGVVRPHRQDRQARDRARRRQHRDGLLPLLAPPRRRGREGRRALRLRGDEGVAVGKGRRHARGHPDPQLPGAQGLHPRQRQADRRRVREGEGRITTPRAAATWCRPASRTSTIPCDDVLVAVGQENAFPGSSATSASSSTSGTCPRSIRRRSRRPTRRCSSAATRAFGPKNIIWAVAHGHDAALSIHKLLLGRGHHRAAAPEVDHLVAEDGHPRVELRQRHLARQALQGAACARRSSR